MQVSFAIFLGALAGLLLLALAGVLYQKLGTASDLRRHPPPGRLIEVGSHRLHINETGNGSPTVVLDAGLPASCVSWQLVQPVIAELARVVSYDRAGLGWSDPGPEPRTSARIVEELHTLLERAGLEGPYVLVGHSFGGFNVRLFAHRYPAEVVGLVLVDPIHPREWLEMPPEKRKGLMRAAQMCRHASRLARVGIARLIAWLVSLRQHGMARWTVMFAFGGALRVGAGERLVGPARNLPPELGGLLRTFWTQPKFFRTVGSQLQSLPESAAQVAEAGPLGDLPLVVLSASNPSPERLADQEAAARLSLSGKHLIASSSGHWIQLDQPELVVHAIRQVVEAARRQRAAQKVH